MTLTTIVIGLIVTIDLHLAVNDARHIWTGIHEKNSSSLNEFIFFRSEIELGGEMEQEGLSDELFEEAVALAAKKFSDQPPGFPFERNIDWSAIQLPPEYEQQLKDESNEDDEDDLADFTEDTGFESVIGKNDTL